MKSLEQYSIPLSGLNLGVHYYEFLVDNEFFHSFENSPIKEGKFKVEIELDKRPSMITVGFSIIGHLNANCDRCLQSISLPVKENYQLLVKYSEDPREENEVVYLLQDTQKINLANYIYEFIVLSLPIAKTYDCENDPKAPCDEETLKYLNSQDNDSIDNPIWSELKNLGNIKK